MRIDKGKLFAMTQPRAYQRLKPSAGLEFIEPAQSPEDLLAHLVALTDAVDNLEILVGTGSFDSEKHCCAFLALQGKATDVAFKQYKTIIFSIIGTTF